MSSEHFGQSIPKIKGVIRHSQVLIWITRLPFSRCQRLFLSQGSPIRDNFRTAVKQIGRRQIVRSLIGSVTVEAIRKIADSLYQLFRK
jgi:hypothetical protein